MLPSFTSQNLINNFKNVDLPHPLSPRIPILSPGFISKFIFFNKLSNLSLYAKLTFSTLIWDEFNSISPSTSSTAGTSSNISNNL